MFKKILIANRGEIAVRIIRAAKELGISTVAIYSEADRDALHVRLADESVCIGPGPNNESYLVDSNVLMAAKITDADAIHPGYGYFSESPIFAEACEAVGVTFIGPPVAAIEAMGDKARARRTAVECGIPTPPGSDGAVTDETEAMQHADRLGFPLLVKAAGGGGGRGIRRVESAEEMGPAFSTAQNEALAAFGDPNLYIEKYLVQSRHVEVQIMADQHGNVLHMFERDCSVQNLRHQKLIEEAPCAALPDEVRRRMGQDAVGLGKAVGYVGAGTVEFLVDREFHHYFIEMNTRLQVEHPVTEMVTGRDVVREQILVAAGEPLSFGQSDLTLSGHAIEARITAEDPDRDFNPSCGTVTEWNVPGGPGVRVETFVHTGTVLSPYYDSLIAKLVVHDADRPRAVARLRRALEEFTVGGVKTNIGLLREIVVDEEYRAGECSTEFLQKLVINGAVGAGAR